MRSICSTKKYKTESSVMQFDGEVQKLKAQKVKYIVVDNVYVQWKMQQFVLGF